MIFHIITFRYTAQYAFKPNEQHDLHSFSFQAGESQETTGAEGEGNVGETAAATAGDSCR